MKNNQMTETINESLMNFRESIIKLREACNETDDPKLKARYQQNIAESQNNYWNLRSIFSRL